jgi:hypothetical protein
VADRKTSVTLEMKASQFKAEADVTKAKVESLDRSVEKLDRDITKIPRDSAKAAAAIKLLGGEADGLKNKLNDVGPGAVTSLQLIDKQLLATRDSVRKFAEDFNKTGSAESLAGLKAANREMRELAKLRKELTAALPQNRQGPGLLSRLAGGLVGEFGGASNLDKGWQGLLKAALTNPAAIAGAVAAAAALGEAIGGALVTGIGLAGIGAGIALQLKDPRVQAALADFKTDLSTGFKGASASFAAPLARGVDILDQGYKKSLPGIQATFEKLAPLVTVLARGASGFLTNVTTGLEHVAVASGPLVRNFASWLPRFGGNLEDLFDAMAAHSAEAERGLNLLEDTVSGLTEAGAKAIPVLSKIGDVLSYVNSVGLAEHIGQLFGVDPSAIHGPGIGALAGQANDFAAATRNLNTALGIQLGYWDRINTDLQKVAQNFDRVFNITLNTQQANDQLAGSFNNLSDSVAQNGDKFKGNSKEALANRDAVRQVEQAILAQRDATIAATGDTDAANAQYAAQQAALRKVLESYHLTTAEIDAMIGALAQVPDKVDTKVNTPGLGSASAGVQGYTGQLERVPDVVPTYINTPGLGSASAEVDLYRGKLYSIPPNVQTHVDVYFTTSGARVTDIGGDVRVSGGRTARRWGGITQHAETGLVNAGIYSAQSPARYAFAEPGTGGEAFVPRFGDYNRSTAILDRAARWYGGRFMPSAAAPVVNVIVSPKDGALGALVDLIDVRVEQGNHATAAAVSGGPRL